MTKLLRGTLVTSLQIGDQSFATIGYPVVDTLKASLLYWDKTCIGIPTRVFTDDLVVAADALKLLGAAEEFELRTTQSGFSADSSFIRACGHSGFPSWVISDSSFPNGGLNGRGTVCIDG